MCATKSVKYTKISQNDTEIKQVINKGSNNTLSRARHLNGKPVCNADIWTQKKLNSLLLEAIHDNVCDKVEKLLQRGANPSSTCRTYKFSSIHLAVLFSCENVLKLLLKYGAKVNGIDRGGLSPLHYAAWHNRPGFIEILLEHLPESGKADFINLKSESQCPVVLENMKDSLDHSCSSFENELPVNIHPGSTALHVASQYIHFRCVEVLLLYDADANVTDERGLTPYRVIGEKLPEIEISSESNFIEIIKSLQSKDTNETIEQIACSYFTPLHAAVMLSSKEGIKILMQESNASYNTFDHYGQTAIHLAIIKQLDISLISLLDCIKDVSVIKNKAGITPFQAAVETQWIQGVGLCLVANADIAEVAADGRTVLHVAARSGNVEFLEELLELEKIETILDAQNNIGETPIFSAVTSGSPQCVEVLLEAEVDIHIKLDGNINILHRAAEQGNPEILLALLKEEWKLKLNLIDELDNSGMTPLHMAALHGSVDCVLELIEYECDYKKKSTGNTFPGANAIHIAAASGHDRVVKALISHDKELMWSTDDNHKEPLHYAALNVRRSCIETLLNEGADLSSMYEDETALDIIYRSISRPTEFLQTVFDHAIQIHNNETLITDKNCMININFSILIPQDDSLNQMSILSNILSNGKGLQQRKLLLHPLIESFLYLKWNKMSTIFWLLLVLYAFFVVFLTIFVVSLFYYTDENRPFLLKSIEVIRFIMISLLLTVTIPEILLASQKLKQYTIKNTDRTIKWTSIILVTILMWSHGSNHEEIWLRHIATFAILASWIEMMFILSKVPNWGYYVQMFFKVASNVLKVMTVFSFLIIGFALAFMIEFQTTEPFSDPLTGIIKTIVMMTAELDYSDLFTGENKNNAKIINLIIFVVFLMLGTVVLMNLLVGLAVSDIHDLEIIGKIDRHSEQIDFLTILESYAFARFLPRKIRMILIRDKCIPFKLSIYPSHPDCKVLKLLPEKLKESLIDIAENNYQKESKITNKHLNDKIDELKKMMEEINLKLSKL